MRKTVEKYRHDYVVSKLDICNVRDTRQKPIAVIIESFWLKNIKIMKSSGWCPPIFHKVHHCPLLITISVVAHTFSRIHWLIKSGKAANIKESNWKLPMSIHWILLNRITSSRLSVTHTLHSTHERRASSYIRISKEILYSNIIHINRWVKLHIEIITN